MNFINEVTGAPEISLSNIQEIGLLAKNVLQHRPLIQLPDGYGRKYIYI